MKGIKEFEKLNENDSFERQYQSVRNYISDLEQNRTSLGQLNAKLQNNNTYIRKMYEAMIAMIDQGRDNIAKNWKSDLEKYNKEHLDLMNQIDTLLKKEESIKAKIDKKVKMFNPARPIKKLKYRV